MIKVYLRHFRYPHVPDIVMELPVVPTEGSYIRCKTRTVKRLSLEVERVDLDTRGDTIKTIVRVDMVRLGVKQQEAAWYELGQGIKE